MWRTVFPSPFHVVMYIQSGRIHLVYETMCAMCGCISLPSFSLSLSELAALGQQLQEVEREREEERKAWQEDTASQLTDKDTVCYIIIIIIAILRTREGTNTTGP